MDDVDIDEDRIDEAILALMSLGLHRDGKAAPWRSWKGFDWEAMNRLHQKGFVSDPVGKANSVMMTEEGLDRCKVLFRTLFAKTV